MARHKNKSQNRSPRKQDENEASTIIKIIPRNLTARADYLVEGNPITSRPESGVDNAFPGLEIDQRNLDQRFFPGLYFEFQREDGAILAKLELKDNQRVSGLTENDLSPERPLFLLGLYGRVDVKDKEPQLFSFYKMTGMQVWRRVHDLLPGRIAILVAPNLESALPQGVLSSKDRLKELDAAYRSRKDVKKFVVHRDKGGSLTYAIFSDNRADYLNDNGVIDVNAFGPGELTKTLCSPWLFDFRDCVCFYWASNKPDMVEGEGKPFLNFMRDRKKPPPDMPAVKYEKWKDEIVSQGTLISGAWKELPVVINDRESPDSFARLPKVSVNVTDELERLALLNETDIINELQYLATVEHALIVEYLYAHYSLNAPFELSAQDKDNTEVRKIFTAASHILRVAIDEMHHFLLVNQLLRLLKCKSPVTGRADVIGLPPKDDKKHKRKEIKGFKYLKRDFKLRPLTTDVLEEFIEIEANSKEITPGATSFGMYIHLLASLIYPVESETKLQNTEHLIPIVKVLIDEGDDHGKAFSSVKETLDGVKGMPVTRDLRLKGEFEQDDKALLDLCDVYYQNLLELIHISYTLQEKAGGELIRVAVILMHEMHEAGHKLAAKNIGLRFTLPEPQTTRRTYKGRDAIVALDAGEKRIKTKLSDVSRTKDENLQRMTKRHLGDTEALYGKMRQTVEKYRR